MNEESTAIMAGENEIEKRNFCARERERATENKGSMKRAPPSSGASDIMVVNCAMDRGAIVLEFWIHSN